MKTVWSSCIAAVFALCTLPAVDLTVVGPVRMADGIGKQSVELIEVLREEIEVSFVPSRKIPEEELAKAQQSLGSLLKNNDKNGKVLLFEDLLTRPPRDSIPKKSFWKSMDLATKNKHQLRFAYSMFESSRLPSAWVYLLNRHFDGVLVPDVFLEKVYRESGVKIPIFTLPLGVNLAPFSCRFQRKTCEKPRVFANFSALYERKNTLTLVKAFAQAFGNSSQVELRLNARRSDPDICQAIHSEIEKYGLENIFLETGALSQEEYIERFSEVDCYVNVAYGEGFSIQPREAMVLGIPTIVSDNSAQATICQSGLVKAIPANIALPAEYKGQFSGTYGLWYGCSVEDVAAALVDVYDHYSEYSRWAEAASNWAMRYDYPNLCPLYMGVIHPKRVVLSKEDKITEDCLFTTSKRLLKKYITIYPELEAS